VSTAHGLAGFEPHREALARAKLVALDVDGVLTDGRVVYVGTAEAQAFDVQDGAALVWLQSHGVRVAWISGRGSPATEKRAGELGVAELHLGVRDKRAVLLDLQRRLGIPRAETIAVGDDLADLGLAAEAGLFVAVANACADVRARAGMVTVARGGAGAVRELAEAILRAQGSWAALLERAASSASGAR
jgi:3-deoxy-D-manno-octulosonate 8-phosphate phosphatase (KDO 8-P phosphatase)